MYVGGADASIRVLYVGDSPGSRDGAAASVEREDDRFDVETAASARAALNALDGGEFDCVVSGGDVPGRDGLEFLAAVREDHPTVPFVFYTAASNGPDASEALSAGASDYVRTAGGSDGPAVLAHRIGDAVEADRSRETTGETERILRQLAEKTEDVLFMFSGDWEELLFINSAFEDVWGIPVEDLEDDPTVFLDHVHPQDKERARRSMERIARGEPDEVEYRVTRPDGDQRWIRGQTKPVFDEDGDVDRVAGFVRDITDRKERERRFEAIFDNSFTFTGLMEPDGTLLEVNETALSFGGLSPEDVIDKPLWETGWVESIEESRERVREGIEQARNGDLFRDELWVEGTNREVVIDFTIRPVSDESGDVTLLVPEGRNITELKNRERVLRVVHRLLRHNIRNDLTTIRGAADTLGEALSDDDLAEFVEIVDAAAEDLLTTSETAKEMVAMILDHPGKTTTLDVGTVVQRVAEQTRERYSQDSVVVSVDGPVVAVCDSRIEAVFEQLIENGLEHNPSTSPRVEVRVFERGGDACVEVADNGPGMPVGEWTMVDEELGDESTQLDHGSGMGLLLARWAVDEFGGSLEYTSQDGDGSVVVVRLPVE